MTDVHLATSYAGDAAQVEDTLGLPSYAQFKRYATFRTDLTDFGVDMKQLTRLLAECEYGLAVGGMGLGDLNVLFAAIAKRSGALTYDGVLRLCRLLRPRLAKLEAMMEATDPDQRDPTRYRPRTAPGGRPGSGSGADLWGTLSGRLRGGGGGGWLHRGGGGGFVGPDPGSSNPQIDFAAGMAAGEGGGSGAAAAGPSTGQGGGAAAAGSQQQPSAAPPGGRSVAFRQVPEQGTSQPAAAAAAPASSNPAGANRISMIGNTDIAGLGGAGGSGPSTSGRASAVPNGLSSLMALRDPPVLLREQLPPPPCSFPSIAARISGIMVLYRDGEMTRVGLALRDLQRDWEDAASAAAVTAAIRRQASAALASSGAAEPSNSDLRGEIPLEGRIWLLLLHGCSLMMDGKYRAARKSLQAAETLFNPKVLGIEHPYHHCTHMFFGLLSYYEQQYEEAIDKFECAKELANLVSRGSLNVTARRNEAACLNNKGVCHSLLGNRSEAVIAFRAAHQLLRPTDGIAEVPEALVAQRNLNKALKQGFALNTARLRPTSAPAMYSHVGSTSIPRDQKLQTFLRTAITMRPPAPATVVPAWCHKVTADDIIARKKAKEAEKKAKAKAAEKAKSGGDRAKSKVKKPPPFDAMTTYPFAAYGLANIKLAAVKRGRRKKAAAAT
ncbi:hypothetical protein VOLCADRAFT_105630 [Volvox carteri f. nagariensis]|uniref:Uncharacterized protein n=1 Tax=Volvox carteri f. nagariensis TaxID=3068 RepID=D8U1Z1_VOLCA|nr:uncharacterized protein VOLCADRAFT_105630 [Volvox carteri f. nagariensis]EFJ46194.1 hypothetical protein VOLCADRAFT_105630 [Volvox carteri f. nagariensis]|eukprot:XP_002952641.1 hypothetical protein VOLCADRAFT_105630 [Volvox carteri f. nagariensis]